MVKSTTRKGIPGDIFSPEYIKKISGISNQKIIAYIDDLFKFLKKKVGSDKIISIILFGSIIINNDTSKISDCDILIILSDDISDVKIHSLEKYFFELEIKHKLNIKPNDFMGSILKIIEKSTGMYVSHFVTRKSHWLAQKFAKVFRVNRIFAFLFAPRNIVLKNMINSSIILLGEDLRYIDDEISIDSFGMIKSIILNLIISIFSIGFGLIYKNTLKYELEAIKWSLKASNFYLFNDSCELNKMIKRFVKLSNQSKPLISFFNRFIYLRHHPNRRSFGYSFLTPINILKIHNLGLSYKKLIKDKK